MIHDFRLFIVEDSTASAHTSAMVSWCKVVGNGFRSTKESKIRIRKPNVVHHPWISWSGRRVRFVYTCALLATLVLLFHMQSYEAVMRAHQDAQGNTYGILDLEFARTATRVATILSVWGRTGQAAARVQTYWDFLFLLGYSTALTLGILSLISRLSHRRAVYNLGITLACGQALAAGLDAVENVCLLAALDGYVRDWTASVAFYCAAVKFGGVILGLIFVLLVLPFQWTNPAPPSAVPPQAP